MKNKKIKNTSNNTNKKINKNNIKSNKKSKKLKENDLSGHEIKEKFNSEIKQLREDFNFFKGIGSILKAIGNALVDIGKAIIGAFKYLVILVKLIVWIFRFAIFILTDILRPDKVVYDCTIGGMNMARSVIKILHKLIAKIGIIFMNSIMGNIYKQFFGWDYGRGKGDKSKDKCYKTEEGKVPMNVLIGTIILPPLGVFMEFGLKAWSNILITSALTMLFYVPGLFYALLLIYN